MQYYKKKSSKIFYPEGPRKNVFLAGPRCGSRRACWQTTIHNIQSYVATSRRE